MLRLTPVLVTFLVCLTACTGDSRSTADVGDGLPAVLLLDTGAGGDYALDARVDVLALEYADGSFTGNLLPAGGSLALVRPSATSSGVSLPVVPPGTYVAVRLLLADGGVTAIGRDGHQESVAVSARDVRAAFPASAELRDDGVRWLVMGHGGVPAIARNGEGRLAWQPDCAARLGDVQPVRDAVLTVAAVEGETILGALASCGGLPVRTRIGEDGVLSDDAGSRERGEFLRDLRPGDQLECAGVLSHDCALLVHRAHLRSRGIESAKAYGEIVGRLPEVAAIRVQVREVVRGGAGLGSPLPVLTVTTSDAVIYRGGAPTVRLDYSALATGQQVVIEWRGPVTDNRVAARKIEIEDEAQRGATQESQGEVAAVDVPGGTLRAVPRGNAPLRVAGQRVPQATVVVGPSTVLVREVGHERSTVTLADVVVGDRIWFWGRAVEPQRVEATAVRLRAAH